MEIPITNLRFIRSNESILKLYNSDVYETLSRESSKLWQEGWIYVFQMMH